MPKYDEVVRDHDYEFTIHEVRSFEAGKYVVPILELINTSWKSVLRGSISDEAIDAKTSPDDLENVGRLYGSISSNRRITNPNGYTDHYVVAVDTKTDELAAYCHVESFQPVTSIKRPLNWLRSTHPNVTDLEARPPHTPRSLAGAAVLFFALTDYDETDRLTFWNLPGNTKTDNWLNVLGFSYFGKSDPEELTETEVVKYNGFKVVQDGVKTIRSALQKQHPVLLAHP